MKGHVLATSSIEAYRRTINGALAYGASRAQMMKVLATSFTHHQIRFKILAPRTLIEWNLLISGLAFFIPNELELTPGCAGLLPIGADAEHAISTY